MERRQRAIDYKKYLEKVKELSVQVVNPGGVNPANYPSSIDSPAKKALYDNLGHNEDLAKRIDYAVLHTKKADWIGNRIKEREIAYAVSKVLGDDSKLDDVMELVKNQYEYK